MPRQAYDRVGLYPFVRPYRLFAVRGRYQAAEVPRARIPCGGVTDSNNMFGVLRPLNVTHLAQVHFFCEG